MCLGPFSNAWLLHVEINSSTRVSGDSGWIQSATSSQPGLGCWWLFIWLFGFIFVFPLFWGRASWSPGWSQACSVAKNDLELPSRLPSAVTGGVCQPSWLDAEPASEPRALHVLDKQSSKGDRPQPRCWALSHQLVHRYSAPAPNSYLNTSPQAAFHPARVLASCSKSLRTGSLCPWVRSEICLITSPVTSCCLVTDSPGHLPPACPPACLHLYLCLLPDSHPPYGGGRTDGMLLTKQCNERKCQLNC